MVLLGEVCSDDGATRVQFIRTDSAGPVRDPAISLQQTENATVRSVERSGRAFELAIRIARLGRLLQRNCLIGRVKANQANISC